MTAVLPATISFGHHLVPRDVLKKIRSSVANTPLVRGKKGAPNIWRIPEDLHKALHRGTKGGAWNEAWWDEIAKRGSPGRLTVDDVLEIKDILIRRFGLERWRP